MIALAGISIFLVRRSSRARDEAEAKLRDNNLNLEATVDERTADLREANDEIQRFAYIVSHDLRSPLVNIMGFTSELEELRGDIFKRIAALARDAVRRAVGPGKRHRYRRARARRRRQAALGRFLRGARLHQIVDRQDGPADIGDPQPHPRGTARVRAGPDRYPRADRGHRRDRGASGRGSPGRRSGSTPLPDIVSDRLALEQIFSNLIDNALKYLKTGVPGEISVRGRTKLGFAIFEISDNGRGIDPKDHQRIFDLFRRAGTQDKPGQGIGLAHVRALVRRLGGTMSVASELHQGSTFTITLPINWPASNRNTRDMSNPVTIIMIEDDEGHARLIERNIRRSGVNNEIMPFTNGTAALNYLFGKDGTGLDHKGNALLILLDLNLPDTTGIDILKRVKENKYLKATPVVVLTTTDDSHEIKRCYELGCNVYITKPVNYESFANAIRQLGLFFSVIQVPPAAT